MGIYNYFSCSYQVSAMEAKWMGFSGLFLCVFESHLQTFTSCLAQGVVRIIIQIYCSNLVLRFAINNKNSSTCRLVEVNLVVKEMILDE